MAFLPLPPLLTLFFVLCLNLTPAFILSSPFHSFLLLLACHRALPLPSSSFNPLFSNSRPLTPSSNRVSIHFLLLARLPPSSTYPSSSLTCSGTDQTLALGRLAVPVRRSSWSIPSRVSFHRFSREPLPPINMARGLLIFAHIRIPSVPPGATPTHTHTPLLYYGVNHHRGQGQWMIVTIWYTTLRAAVGQPPHPLSQRKGGATVGSQDPRCRESEIRSKTLKDTLPFPRVNMNVSTYPISLESFTQCLLLVTHLRYIPIFPPLLRYIYLYTNYGCDIRDASCKFR